MEFIIMTRRPGQALCAGTLDTISGHRQTSGTRWPRRGALECGGKRKRHAALAYDEETSQLGPCCGRK